MGILWKEKDVLGKTIIGMELVPKVSFSCYYPTDAAVNLRCGTVHPMSNAFKNKCMSQPPYFLILTFVKVCLIQWTQAIGTVKRA